MQNACYMLPQSYLLQTYSRQKSHVYQMHSHSEGKSLFFKCKKPYFLLRGSFNQQLKVVKCFALETALPSSKKDKARRQKLRCQLRLKYFSISKFFVCIQFALHVYTSIITPYRCCRMSWIFAHALW